MISPTRVLRWLFVAILLLVAASTAGQVSKFFFGHGRLFGLVRLLDVNEEAAVPEWFSSVMLLVCGAMLSAIAVSKRRRGDRYARHWIGLAVLFVYLAMDEAAAIHETWGEPLSQIVPREGFLYFTWVIPGALVVGAVVLLYLPFVWALPKTIRVLFVLAGVLFIGGSLALEVLSGEWISVFGRSFGYSMLNSVEETLEMAGTAVFIYAVLQYLAQDSGGVRLVIRKEGGRDDGAEGPRELTRAQSNGSTRRHSNANAGS